MTGHVIAVGGEAWHTVEAINQSINQSINQLINKKVR